MSASWRTMRFGSTAKVLLKCKLKYYRISECGAPSSADPRPLGLPRRKLQRHQRGAARCDPAGDGYPVEGSGALQNPDAPANGNSWSVWTQDLGLCHGPFNVSSRPSWSAWRHDLGLCHAKADVLIGIVYIVLSQSLGMVSHFWCFTCKGLQTANSTCSTPSKLPTPAVLQGQLHACHASPRYMEKAKKG